MWTKANNYGYRNRSYSQDRNQSYNRGRGNFYYNRNYRPNYRARSRSRNYGYGNGYRGNEAVDKIIGEAVTDKTMVTKGIGIEVQVKTTVGLGKDIEAILEITSEIGPMTEVKVGLEIGLAVERKDKGSEQNPKTGIEKIGVLQDLDLVPVLIPTGIDLDALDVVNMTILQENALML